MKELTLNSFLLISDFITQECADKLQSCTCPTSLCDRVCPPNLDDLQFGQLLELQSITEVTDFLFVPAFVVLGIPKSQLLQAPVSDVFGFSSWCAKEIEEIGKLFKEASGTPTPEEREAGIEQLNFGAFGMIDWFALRMGFKNHNEVLSVSWLHVYQCLSIDTQKRDFERRLRQVYSNKTTT